MANVLLVDDESVITSLYEIVLTRTGHQVVCANNAEKAADIGLNMKPPIDVLVTDWRMPGLTGDWLARRLLNALPNIGVILMSGYDEAEQVAKTIDPSRVIFLSKPFSPALLQDKIRALVAPATSSLAVSFAATPMAAQD
jgi:DNA-binding NtrC family response regulator